MFEVIFSEFLFICLFVLVECLDGCTQSGTCREYISSVRLDTAGETVATSADISVVFSEQTWEGREISVI